MTGDLFLRPRDMIFTDTEREESHMTKGRLDAESLCARADELFNERGYSCSETVLAVMNEVLADPATGGTPLPEDCLRVAGGFGGGMAAGGACGALCGGGMALSLALCAQPGSMTYEEKESIAAVMRDYHDAFVARNGSADCREIIAGFEGHYDPARKAFCTHIVRETVADLARIFNRIA